MEFEISIIIGIVIFIVGLFLSKAMAGDNALSVLIGALCYLIFIAFPVVMFWAYVVYHHVRFIK